jgi:hypothetical protein
MSESVDPTWSDIDGGKLTRFSCSGWRLFCDAVLLTGFHDAVEVRVVRLVNVDGSENF